MCVGIFKRLRTLSITQSTQCWISEVSVNGKKQMWPKQGTIPAPDYNNPGKPRKTSVKAAKSLGYGNT
jgi:hypothetical protein